MMKYALLIYGAQLVPEALDAESREGWTEYARAAKEAGILLGAEQLAGTDTATSVRVRGGQRLLADQDRARWDAALIAEGTAVLDAAVASPNGPWFYGLGLASCGRVGWSGATASSGADQPGCLIMRRPTLGDLAVPQRSRLAGLMLGRQAGSQQLGGCHARRHQRACG
jgi:hypothetical protein